MDPFEITSAIVMLPVIIVLILWYVYQRKTRSRSVRKDLHFVLGFICLSLFYIFAPDPSVIQKLYVEGGDITTTIIYSGIAGLFLALSVIVFKRYRE